MLAADGTWRGTIGKMTASGAATRRRGLLVLDGSLRWGEITTPFNGVRDEHALVALRKTP
jgi:hypothetical protein